MNMRKIYLAKKKEIKINKISILSKMISVSKSNYKFSYYSLPWLELYVAVYEITVNEKTNKF